LETEILNLRKTALIFGEKNYKYANPLNNPLNDAQDIADSLRKIGFVVNVAYDAGLQSMDSAIDRWCSTLPQYNVGVFYYSGHGAEYNSENYIFPIDARPHSPAEMSAQCISANQLLSRIENTNVHFSIMILDACRSNPFTRTWGRSATLEGLAAMTGRGSFIGYAAAPGATASDGVGHNGTYTEGILKYITVPDLPIDEIFTRVNSYVQNATNGGQIPYKTSSLNSDFCFSVRRTLRPSRKSSNLPFQPPSSAFVTTEQSYLINTTDTGISIKDALTLSTLRTIGMEGARPSALIAGPSNNIFALDAAHKKIYEFDASRGVKTSEIQLDSQPTAVAANDRQDKIYVGSRGVASSGGLSCFLSGKDKADFTRSLNFAPKSIAIANDDKNLYLLSNDSIYQYNLKLDKVQRKISGFKGGSNLAITPDNKDLFVSGEVEGGSKLLIYDISSWRLKSQLPLTVSTISFTTDSLYAYVGSGINLYVISLADFSIINRTSVSSEIAAIAIMNDNAATVWLPKEDRFYLYSSDQLLNNSDVDLEAKLKNFIASEKKDYKADSANRAELGGFFAKMHQVYDSTVSGLANELGAPYHVPRPHGVVILDGTYVWGFVYEKKMFGGSLSISSFMDRKSIYTYFLGRIDAGVFYLEIYDRQGSPNPPTVFKAQVQDVSWTEMSKFVRKYFLKRLDEIK
jgi:hypothetical protein